ncbi:hypothetical protein BVI434_370093 [Burkholderia vietnamiensis]|nr:hypothetical protein BVI434_370093 [Burkholderia vietnamiensis]
MLIVAPATQRQTVYPGPYDQPSAWQGFSSLAGAG